MLNYFNEQLSPFTTEEEFTSIIELIRNNVLLTTIEVDRLELTLKEIEKFKNNYNKLKNMVDRLWADKQDLALDD
jgi:hypothetical protein